jgi:hypothetical protein
MKMAVFWDVSPSSLVETDGRFWLITLMIMAVSTSVLLRVTKTIYFSEFVVTQNLTFVANARLNNI